MMQRLSLTLCCVLVALVWAAPAAAQTGIKGGIVWADLEGELEDGAMLDRRTAWAAGLFLRFRLGGPLTAQAEALYAKRGASIEGAGVTGEPEIRMTYVEVPVLLRLGSGSTAIYGGGYGALKLDAELIQGDDVLDLSPQIEDFDYGLVVGASIGLGSLELEGRYIRGLRNLMVDPSVPEIEHRAISVMVGFTF